MNRRLFLIWAMLGGGCSAPPPARYRAAEQGISHPVLLSLAGERAHFLRTGDPEAVFSVFYYHVTAEILRQLQAGKLREPDVVLELITEFSAAWQRNRSAVLREPHWEPYFRRADELRRTPIDWRAAAHVLDRLSPRSLPALAVNAHVDYDLPVCLSRVLRRHPGLRGVRLDAFEASFHSLDSIFYDCTFRGFQDLATRIPGAPGARGMAFQSRMACRVIEAKRHRAWEAALRMLDSPA